jgi:hypothetical protein
MSFGAQDIMEITTSVRPLERKIIDFPFCVVTHRNTTITNAATLFVAWSNPSHMHVHVQINASPPVAHNMFNR